MKNYNALILPLLLILPACGETKPTAIEVSDLGKVAAQCFIKRTPTIDDALNQFSGLRDLGSYVGELGQAPIKNGWKITSEDRTTATLDTTRDGVQYECDFAKAEDTWTLTRSLWDGEEAYSLEAEAEIKARAEEAAQREKEEAQRRQDITWKENSWIGESYKFYSLPPRGVDSFNDREIAINCEPEQRAVMLNGFFSYGDGQNVEFLFDGFALEFGVSGGGSNSYLGDISDSSFGTRVSNRVEVGDRFIEALKQASLVEVMGHSFVIEPEELKKVPCVYE